MKKENVKKYFEELGIKFVVHKHPAVYTVEEANKYIKGDKFLHCKNLFVKDRKSRRFYLIILPAEKKLSLNDFENELNEKLKFANEKDLEEILDIYPGAVSPFTLINDKEHKVIVVVDKDIFDSEKVGFHPNDNTETWEISSEGLKKYLDSLDNEMRIIK